MKNLFRSISVIGVSTMILASCATDQQPEKTISGLDPAAFDSIINGKKTELFTLKNKNGMEVCITNFGGRVVSDRKSVV